MKRVPFLSLDPLHEQLRDEMLSAFERFYDSGRYILADQVAAFEQAYAEFSGTRFCVGVGSGLDAIRLSLEALGIGEGDEVIVPSNTFFATWLAVTRTGAELVPVEPDPRTANIDPARIADAVGRRTRAVIPVHLHGRPCEMDAVMSVADGHGIAVIEDNAQAHGATYRGRPTGSFGRINATSFYPTKILGALGDAGAVTTDDEELAEEVRALRSYGSRAKDRFETFGFNSRLDEVQAALLAVKLAHVEQTIEDRRRSAGWYREELEGLDDLHLPDPDPDATHANHLFVVRTSRRDALQRHLAECGIETMIHYPVPPHLQPAYRELGFERGRFPIAEELAETSLSLPFFVGISREQVGRVADQINEFFTLAAGTSRK